MRMDYVRLLSSDGSWGKFQDDWTAQCEKVDCEISEYASDAMEPIHKLACNPEDESWSIAIKDGEQFRAALIVHRVNQKGYDAPVLRVRHIVVCPLLDEGELDIDVYVNTIVHILYYAIKLSETPLSARYIKMHVRSPGDIEYFRAMSVSLDKQRIFEFTELKGAWLTLKRRPQENANV